MDADWETCMTMNQDLGLQELRPRLEEHRDAASESDRHRLEGRATICSTSGRSRTARSRRSRSIGSREIGKWMKANGEAIYGTTASPTAAARVGPDSPRKSADGTTLYLHVFDWPADGKLPVAVDNEVVGCSLLAEPSRKFDVQRSARKRTDGESDGRLPPTRSPRSFSSG